MAATQRPLTHRLPTERQFLALANTTRRTRLFTAEDYQQFLADIRLARKAPGPWYSAPDAGAVPNAYTYKAYTAQYLVCVLNDGSVYWWVGNAVCNGRYARCPIHLGERGYTKAYHEERMTRTSPMLPAPVPRPRATAKA